MAHRILTLALAAGAAIGIAALAHAQGYGGASGPGGWVGPTIKQDTAPSGGRNGNPTGPTTGQGTTGQGGSWDRGASEFAPGRDPGSARDTNPGRGGGTPPGQMNEQKTRPGSGNR